MTSPQSIKQFYRRELPKGCTEFSSDEGKTIFREALSTGYMDCYFKLAAQFRTQDEPAFCGLSTLVMVLNALSVDPGRVWKGPWRWYHESMLDCCTSLSVVKKEGITFDNFVCLAECNYLIASPRRADESFTEDEFRDIVRQTTRQDKRVLVISYSRIALSQTGDGHFSPIGGYHEAKDLVLVLDTARFKYPPHWVPLTTLVTAMKSLDQDTGKPRGCIILSRDFELSPLLLFRISPLLSVTLKNGLCPEIQSFVSQWLKWLGQPADASSGQNDVVRQSVAELLRTAAAFLSGDACILTSQLDAKCPELVSEGHMCVVRQLVESLEGVVMFRPVSTAIQDHVVTSSRELLSKVCRTSGVPQGVAQCYELLLLLTPAHFFTALLLSWPYMTESKSDTSHAAVLRSVAQSCLQQGSGVLQNEVLVLKQQLRTVLKLYCRKSLCTCKPSS